MFGGISSWNFDGVMNFTTGYVNIAAFNRIPSLNRNDREKINALVDQVLGDIPQTLENNTRILKSLAAERQKIAGSAADKLRERLSKQRIDSPFDK